MCQDSFQPRLAPLQIGHLSAVIDLFPQQRSFATDVYEALTQDLNPALPALATLVVLKEDFDHGHLGLFAEVGGARVPLSIVGTDGARYRTEVVGDLHETWLPLAMAQKNCEALDEVMAVYGRRLYRTCSCGIVMTRAGDRRLDESELLKRMDSYRSSLDRRGYPVVSIANYDDIPVPNIDLAPADRKRLERIRAVVEMLAHEVPWDEATFVARRHLTSDAAWLAGFADSVRSRELVAA